MNFKFSRRQLMGGTAALAGARAFTLGGEARAQAASKPAVVLIYLTGGYNALFSSADSFAPQGTFGCSSGNIQAVGNGLVVDKATFGTLPAAALNKMAAVGIKHNHNSHDIAERAAWTDGTRSYALQLANAMGGTAAIKCAVMGSHFPMGPAPAEGSVTYQQINSLSSTIAALGGGTANPILPDRATAAAALGGSQTMSQAATGQNPTSLGTLGQAFGATIDTLKGNVQTFNYNTMAAAYGVPATSTSVGNSFTMQMLGAELMILAGANVVTCVTGFAWDSHGDTDGSGVRGAMNNQILPPLKVFLNRMLGAAGFNVTVAFFGDFARSLPGSDHASVTSATVIGSNVKVGTTGRVDAAVGFPNGTPDTVGYWSYLAALARVGNNPFGANPHTSITG